MDTLDSIDLVPILKQLPEFQPKIVPLSWKVMNENGDIDIEKAAFHYTDIQDAMKEANDYSNNTRELGSCLMKLVLY